MNLETFDFDYTINELKKYIKKQKEKIRELYNIIYEQGKEISRLKENNSSTSYTIDKDTFINCLSAMEGFYTYTNELSNYDINIFENKAVEDFIIQFENLFLSVNDDSPKNELYSDINYFIYDLNFGKDWDPSKIRDAEGNPIDFSTAEKLWEYLQTRN